MFKKFLSGLVLGAGFAIAFVVIWAIALSYLIPAVLENATNKSPDMVGGTESTVVPIDIKPASSRKFTLHKDQEEERTIPVGGGILSIAVLEEDSGKIRPSSFQAWVTESEAFVISTDGDIPTIKKVPYPETKAIDYAVTLVYDNVGFQKQNITMHVKEGDVNRLKDGKAASRDEYLNGQMRATVEGVVFFIPNEYEYNN